MKDMITCGVRDAYNDNIAIHKEEEVIEDNYNQPDNIISLFKIKDNKKEI